MKVIWNNKIYQLTLPKIVIEDKVKRSNLHKQIKTYLREKFPLHLIYEEVRLPGVKLTVDFYVPELGLMIEAQGAQHYKYVKHFHRNRLGMLSDLKNDKLKKEWCEQNGIELVEIKYDQWEEDLRRTVG